MAINPQKQAAKKFVNTEVKKVAKRELEISVQAGKIVGTLYDALLKQYAEPDSPETLKALNKLCDRSGGAARSSGSCLARIC